MAPYAHIEHIIVGVEYYRPARYRQLSCEDPADPPRVEGVRRRPHDGSDTTRPACRPYERPAHRSLRPTRPGRPTAGSSACGTALRRALRPRPATGRGGTSREAARRPPGGG